MIIEKELIFELNVRHVPPCILHPTPSPLAFRKFRCTYKMQTFCCFHICFHSIFHLISSKFSLYLPQHHFFPAIWLPWMFIVLWIVHSYYISLDLLYNFCSYNLTTVLPFMQFWNPISYSAEGIPKVRSDMTQ